MITALRILAGSVLGLGAGAVELLSLLSAFRELEPLPIELVGAAHAAASLLCLLAAAVLGTATSATDRRLVLLTAALVPLFGPAAAWLFAVRRGDLEVLDAHAWFERYEEQLAGPRIVALCPPEQEDVELPADVMSFSEVLRRGGLDHRRNALRRLAESGTPRHLRLLRTVLYDDNVELRLCAYAEVQRLSRGHEDGIAELLAEVDRHDREHQGDHAGRHRLLTRLASAHQAYAASGLLDPEMARYHLQQAVRCAEESWMWQPGDRDTCLAYARALSDLGDHKNALRAFERLKDDDLVDPEVSVQQAEIAFRGRDFALARLAAERLRGQRLTLPDWLRALTPAEGKA